MGRSLQSNTRRRRGARSLEVGALLLGGGIWAAPAAAQQILLVPQSTAAAPAPNAAPEAVELPSLRGPRLELIGGGALVIAGPLTGFLIAFLRGPPLFPCGLDLFGDDVATEEDAACERRADAQRRQAAREGAITGAVLGTLGTALLIHGGIRLKRARAARDAAPRRPVLPEGWSVQATSQRTHLSLSWRF
jgi:hypothetical protein